MTGPNSSTFAVLLKQLRIRARLTHEELAEKSRVAVRTISDLERGISTTPRKETVQRLADALELIGTVRDEFEAAAREHRASIAGPPTTRTLPRDLASFTGRKPELRWVLAAAGPADAVGAVGIYAIAGMAGVGKTALALRAAHRLAGQFPDGQLFLDLRGYTDGLDPLSAQQALGSLLRALGTPAQLIPEDPEERAAFYRSRLAGTRTLIILDNALSTAQVKPLLPGTAGCLVIVTSRRSLRGLDDARALALEVLPEADAITLFRTVAGPDRVSADDPALAEIIALCGHLPLAVRIIAARMAYRKALRVEDLARQLRHERGRLAHLQDEDRNMTAVFALSYWHLPDLEQHLFRYLGLIPGPDFDAYAVANLIDAELDIAGRLLESLLDHNLLIQRTPGRYRFHDLVRVYARTLTSTPATTGRTSVPGAGAAASTGAPDTPDAALDRVLDYYLYTAQAADRRFERRTPLASEQAAVARPRVGPPLNTLEQVQVWLSAELANLDAATYYAAGHDRPGCAIALPAALAEYLRAHGPWTQALALHQCALDTARAIGSRRGQADALAHLAVVQRQSGALALARDSLTQALDLYGEPGERHGLAGGLVELAVVQRLTAQHPQAEASLTRALDLYRELSDRHGEAAALAELGVVQRQIGAFAQAEDTLSGALGLFRELGNRFGEAAVLSYLGSVQWSTGATARAEHSLTGALRLYHELGDRMGQANNLLYLGCVQREAGAYPQARATLTETLDLYTELGERRGQAGALTYLGVVQRLTSQYTQADESLTRALALFRELGDRGGEAEALNHYAQLIAVTSSPLAARGHYNDALRLAREIRSAKDEADALDGIAATYRSEGNISEAAGHYRQARALYLSLGCTADAARVQAVLDTMDSS